MLMLLMLLVFFKFLQNVTTTRTRTTTFKLIDRDARGENSYLAAKWDHPDYPKFTVQVLV